MGGEEKIEKGGTFPQLQEREGVEDRRGVKEGRGGEGKRMGGEEGWK